MLGRSAGGDVQRTNIFARALFEGWAGDAPHQTIILDLCVRVTRRGNARRLKTVGSIPIW
jgi:hypothetical protein